MPVQLTDEDYDLFNANGYTDDDVVSLVKSHRDSGLDDNAIRVKLDEQLNTFRNPSNTVYTNNYNTQPVQDYNEDENEYDDNYTQQQEEQEQTYTPSIPYNSSEPFIPERSPEQQRAWYEQAQQQDAIKPKNRILEKLRTTPPKQIFKDLTTPEPTVYDSGYMNKGTALPGTDNSVRKIDSNLYGIDISKRAQKNTPIRDLGFNIGNNALNFISGSANWGDKWFGTKEDRALLKQPPEYSSVEIQDMLARGELPRNLQTADMMAKSSAYERALEDRKFRDERNQDIANEALLLGTSVLPLPGINAVSRFAGKSAINTYKALRSANVSPAVSKVMANLTSYGIGTTGRGVTVGAPFGVIDYGMQKAMGKDANFKQSLEESIKTAMLIDGLFGGLAVAGNVTGLAKELKKLPSYVTDSALNALKERGHEGLADVLERAGVNVMNFLGTDIKTLGENVRKRADLSNKITRAAQLEEERTPEVLAEYQKHFGGLNDEQLDTAYAMANKNVSSTGERLAEDPILKQATETPKGGYVPNFELGASSPLYGQPKRPQPKPQPQPTEEPLSEVLTTPGINIPKIDLPEVKKASTASEYIPNEKVEPIITPEQTKKAFQEELKNPKPKAERTERKGGLTPRRYTPSKPSYKTMNLKEAPVKEEYVPVEGKITKLEPGVAEGAEGSSSMYKRTPNDENQFRGVEGNENKNYKNKLKEVDNTEFEAKRKALLEEKQEKLNNLYDRARAVSNAYEKGLIGKDRVDLINKKINSVQNVYKQKEQALFDKYQPKPEAHKYSFARLPKSVRAKEEAEFAYNEVNSEIAKAEQKVEQARLTHKFKGTSASKKRLNEARERLKELRREQDNISVDKGNYTEDVRRQAEKETQNIDTNEDTLRYQEGLNTTEDFGVPELTGETHNKDVDMTNLINSYKNAETKEAKAKVIEDLIVGKEHNPKEVNNVINKLLDEESKIGRRQYAPGDEGARQYAEDQARSENINNLINDLVASSSKLKKNTGMTAEDIANADKTLAKANIELNTDEYGHYRNETTKNLQKEAEDIIKSQKETTNKTAKKSLGIKASDTISLKSQVSKNAIRDVYKRPINTVYKDIKNAENSLEKYNSYIDTVTKNIKYDMNNADKAIRRLNALGKRLEKEGYEVTRYRSVKDFLSKSGNKVMEDLKVANEQGNLFEGKKIIDEYKDLLELNEEFVNGERKWKYFSNSQVEEHYNISNERATDLLTRLKNPSTRRNALLEIEEMKGGKFEDLINEKLAKLDPESAQAIKLRKQLGEGTARREDKVEFLKTLSPDELEVYARARAREIYKNYYKVLKNYRTNYSVEQSRILDKDKNPTHNYHTFDKELPEDYDVEAEWKKFQNEIEPFLDFKTWRDRPDIEKYTSDMIKSNYGNYNAEYGFDKANSDVRNFEKDNRAKINYAKRMISGREYFGKNEDGTKFSELQRLEKYFKKNNIDKIEDYVNKYGRSGVEYTKLKQLDSYNTYKEYLSLQEKANKAREELVNVKEEYKNVAKFKNEQEKIDRMSEDNPFEKDIAQYRDTKTGAIDYKQVKRDLDLMEDESYLKAKAKEATKGKSHYWYKKKLAEYEKQRDLLNINYGDRLNDVNHNGIVRSYSLGDMAKLTETEGTEAGRYTQKLLDSVKEDEEALAFFKSHPKVRVEIAEKGTHGADAEVIFSPEGKDVIRLYKDSSDELGELKLLKDEFAHIKEYDKIRAGDEEAIKIHREAFAKADEAYAEYNKNRNFIDNVVKNKVLDKYLNEQEIEKLNNWKNKVKIQKATKAEQEAHNGKRDNQSTSRDSENISEGKSRGTDGSTRVSEGTSGSYGNSNAGLRQTLDEFRGKSLNKYSEEKTIRDLAENLGKEDTARLNAPAKRIRQQGDILNMLAREMGATNGQLLNRELMTGERYVSGSHKVKGKKGLREGKEKVGIFGKKVRDAEKNLTTREKILSNQLEIHRRQDVISLNNTLERYYGKPIAEKTDSDIPINKAIFNMCAYNGYTTETYNTIMSGDVNAIRKMFKGEGVADSIIELYNNNRKLSYCVPERIFKHVLPGFGENLKIRQSRYGKFSKRALTSIIGTSRDDYLSNAKRNMLFSPQWALGNIVGSSVMSASHMGLNKFLRSTAKAFTLKEKDLPVKLFGNNLFEELKVNQIKPTGKPVVDAFRNLYSGRFIPLEGLNKIQKTLAVGANTLNLPYVGIRKLSDMLSSLAGKTETFIRKINAVNQLEDNKKAIILNMTQRMEKQNITLKTLADELVYNPKNLDLQKHIIKEIEDICGEYRVLTPFEKNVIRRVVPFNTWLRSITRCVSKLAKDNPTQFAMTLLEVQRLKDLDADKKDWQKLSIPIRNPITGKSVTDRNTGEQLYFNLGNYINLFSTFEEKPSSIFAPDINALKDSLTGRSSFNDKMLKSPRYVPTKDFSTGVTGIYDKKAKKMLRDEDGNPVTKLPLKESLKHYPITAGRMGIIGGSGRLINLEQIYGALDNYSSKNNVDKARAGKFSPYNTLYDTSLGGFNVGDYDYTPKTKKTFQGQDYYVDGKKKYKFGKNLSTGTKMAKYFIANAIQPAIPLSEAEKNALEVAKNIPDSKLFGYIPTRQTKRLRTLSNYIKDEPKRKEKEALEKIKRQTKAKKNKS